MRVTYSALLMSAATLALSALLFPASAQTRGTGTDTVLPRPEAPFKGKIGETYKDSTPDFPRQIHAPDGAPNVLLILLDDVGFGHAGTFGGAVKTTTMDRLARDGIVFNQFHTTALCSPTRAALLTGRNHTQCRDGRDYRDGDRVSRLYRDCSTFRSRIAGSFTPQRVRDGCFWQVA